MPGPSSTVSSTASERSGRRMRRSRPRRFRMQPPLPLAGLIAPPPLAWEHLAPGEQLEAVAVLARLMAQLVQPTPEEGETDD